MRKLKAGRRAARSGKASSLVILVHGYGADGADLLGLADPLGEHMPDTVFVAPNAPNRSPRQDAKPSQGSNSVSNASNSATTPIRRAAASTGAPVRTAS